MKKIILITLSISLFVEGDYLAHPKSQALIDELVTNHGFEQSFVEDVLSNAVRQQKIIDSIRNHNFVQYELMCVHKIYLVYL